MCVRAARRPAFLNLNGYANAYACVDSNDDVMVEKRNSTTIIRIDEEGEQLNDKERQKIRAVATLRLREDNDHLCQY